MSQGLHKLNVLTSGANVHNNAYPLYTAKAASKDDALGESLPFGLIGGCAQGVPDWFSQIIANWHQTNIGSPTSPNTTNNPAVSGTGNSMMTLATGTANTTGTEWNLNGAGHPGGSQSAPLFFLPRLGSDGNECILSYYTEFEWSNNDLNWLVGLTPAAGTSLSTAGAINVNDGIFLYHAAGSANLVAHVVGASTDTNVILDTAATAGTLRRFGFIATPSFVKFFMDQSGTGGLPNVSTVLTGFTTPANPLGYAMAGVNSTANNRTLQWQTLVAMQEKYS